MGRGVGEGGRLRLVGWTSSRWRMLNGFRLDFPGETSLGVRFSTGGVAFHGCEAFHGFVAVDSDSAGGGTT